MNLIHRKNPMSGSKNSMLTRANSQKVMAGFTPPLGNQKAGFTIIELIIATAVFSIILLMATFALLQIGRTYYKGITTNKTQQTSRNVTDEISRAIQFSGSGITETTNDSKPFCIGDQRYSYKLNQQVENSINTPLNQGYHALVVDSYAGCNGSSPKISGFDTANPGESGHPAGRELLETHMRLAKLVVKKIADSNLYQVTIRVVYGDSDLLDDKLDANGNPGTDGVRDSCSSTRQGGQFCAVSELSTVVEKRL